MKSTSSDWYLGLFMHTPCMGKLEVLENALMEIDCNGTIASITPATSSAYDDALSNARGSQRLHTLPAGQLFIPGLIDLHVHAPQWPQLGKALHLPLQDWLQQFTFPLEARYQDASYARRVYESLVSTLLANGTTTAMYFSSIHQEATQALASICLAKGQRAYVGRVAMDDSDQCPDYYRDADAQCALIASENSLHSIRALDGNQRGLVKPVITPRFIPSCTNELLAGLGELAAQHGCHVQTHCSESDWEHAFVQGRLGMSDAQALASFGLLNRHTVLAHSNFITDSDMELIQSTGSGIAHCPLSNSYFADSVFPLRQALNKSLRVGLGTDIAGGHSASMFNACQHAVSSSRMLDAGVDTRLTADERGRSGSRINFIEAFFLATAGAADVLDAPVGSFQTGRQFDALLLNLEEPASHLNEFVAPDAWEELLGCIVYNTQISNIKAVWVDGRQVSGSLT